MICLQLYWSYLKIGFCSFGGLSMIPFINQEMLAHHWMTMEQLSDIVAIAEMTPVPSASTARPSSASRWRACRARSPPRSG